MILVYSLIGFLGLFIGELFHKKFREEVDFKWFKIIRKIVLLVILGVLLFNFDFFLLIGILIGFLVSYFIKNIYFYLGFVFLLGFNEVAGLLSGLVFIFGLFNKFKVKYLFYFLPLVLLFFQVGFGLFYGFAIGGILNYVIGYKRFKK